MIIATLLTVWGTKRVEMPSLLSPCVCLTSSSDFMSMFVESRPYFAGVISNECVKFLKMIVHYHGLVICTKIYTFAVKHNTRANSLTLITVFTVTVSSNSLVPNLEVSAFFLM